MEEDGMGNLIIILVLVLIIAMAVLGTVKRIRYGSSCCGEHDPADKKIRVKDRKKSNYAYTYILRIDGMHCSNCARRIENAFNQNSGRWATADVGNKEVTLLSKYEEEESELGKIVSDAGYTMISCCKK
jgi:copper chaperone CopZ